MTKPARRAAGIRRTVADLSVDDPGVHLADLGFVGFWQCNFKTKRVRISPELARFYGLRCVEEHTECDLADLQVNILPEDQAWSERWRPMAIDSTGIGTIQYRIYDEEGHTRWVLCRGRYKIEPDGAIETGHGIVFDITAAKREGKKILSPEDGTRDPVEHLADLLIEAHGVAGTMADSGLTGALSGALMRVGILLAKRMAAGPGSSSMH